VRVGLMIPCYIDMFYPQIGVATLELLEKLGVEVDYPFDQTCCGQPMANSGAYKEAKATEELFVRNFAGYDHIVAPSGSCAHHLRNKFTAADDTPERRHVSAHVHDLPEFLCDVLQVDEFPWAEFPHQVALHVSCSAIRGLYEQAMSERPNDPWFSKPRSLLEKVKGLSLPSSAGPMNAAASAAPSRSPTRPSRPPWATTSWPASVIPVPVTWSRATCRA
jgi:L-lactate dehydrogenase complex protein LldE